MPKTIPIPKLNERQLERFLSRIDTSGDCHEWQSQTMADGYGIIDLNRRKYLAHRIAYKLAYKRDPGSKMVCHSCDNPPCCNPKHLFLGTQLLNIKDRHRKGRSRCAPHFGERNPAAKLTWVNVKYIRRSKLSSADLSRKFSISQSVICNIRKGNIWKRAA